MKPICRPSILVMDEDPAEIWMLKHCLDEYNHEPYEMTTIGNGEQALRYAEGTESAGFPNPSIIVVDLNLPVHDGIEIVQALQGNPTFSQCKILLVSMTLSPGLQKKAQSLMVTCRQKPGSIEDYKGFSKEVLRLARS